MTILKNVPISPSKPISKEKLLKVINNAKKKSQVIGLCHGCFDIFHFGHLRHLESAASQCDILIVSITADRFVNKGEDRPIFKSDQRAEVIAGLSCVNFSFISEYASAIEVLDLIKPNKFFKGQEYMTMEKGTNPNFKNEQVFSQKNSIEICFTQEEVYSSSLALEKLKEGKND